MEEAPFVPEPQAASSDYLIGCHYFPGWKAGTHWGWAKIEPYPERKPLLGWYDEENPEVTDWEVKWALEHGIRFFLYCWYRDKERMIQPMDHAGHRLGHAIHEGLFRSRYGSRMKFAIMWETHNAGVAASEDDLVDNLLPYWIDTYFSRPNYLALDGKPVLFVYTYYSIDRIGEPLGGEGSIARVFDRMREKARSRGFAGLTISFEYRQEGADGLRRIKNLGADSAFAYCWHTPQKRPTADQAIAHQLHCLESWRAAGLLPYLATASVGWDPMPWQTDNPKAAWLHPDTMTRWKLSPEEFRRLLTAVKAFMDVEPEESLARRMLLLDNWNEWGEGHYIAPYREYGFGYLDAVRTVFSDAPEAHVDLLPEDIGLGPYDKAIRDQLALEKQARRMGSKLVRKEGWNEPGLVAWWTFDEEADAPVALDYSGHRLGGGLKDVQRVKGLAGRALDCKGGSVTVPNSPTLSLTAALTIECWVKTDLAGQDNKWLVNRIYSGGTDTGYRLGILAGAPCFNVPQTSWSHHLKGDKPLPTGRWVHLAGTFDGQTMRLYMDGEQVGTMERPGPAKPNDFSLCLGSYEAGHPAYFTGLLDEVRLYDRALTPEQIREHARPR